MCLISCSLNVIGRREPRRMVGPKRGKVKRRVVKKDAWRDTHYFCSSTNIVRSNKGRFDGRGSYCARGSYETRKELQLECLNGDKGQLESPNGKQENNNKIDHKEIAYEVVKINRLVQEGDQRNSGSINEGKFLHNACEY